MDRADIASPSIVVVIEDATSRAAVGRELDVRYGASYSVVMAASATEGLAAVRAATAENGLAVVLADEAMSEMPAVDLLAAVREIDRVTRRALLIDPRIRTAVRAAARPWMLGQFDYFVTKPETSPDERFHRAVTDLLDEWWRLRGRGVEMFKVVGPEQSARMHEICDLLSRHDYPYGRYSCDTDDGLALLRKVDLEGERRPVVILPTGRAFVDPTNREVGEAFGALVRPGPDVYDLTIIGGGPSGLAAAVYAGSEGLHTALVEPDALGGQAGTSSLIRNYLGFPRGISGAELASRAVEQASLFGTEIIYGSRATSLRSDGVLRVVGLSNGSEAVSRAVVVATGVSYRRLGIGSLDALIGAGVFYGAGSAEARALAGEDVFVVGGGNSAGQAAVHLARYASQVTILVRSDSLAASMSDYLITEIDHAPNIDVRYRVRVVGGGGAGRLSYLELDSDGHVEIVEAGALFVLIGAEPFTDWLPESVARDQWGYVLTGSGSVGQGWSDDRAPLPLETSLPGVFAVGDVRSGSVKRIAAGVGDGSICIRLVHEYLALAAATA